MILKSSGRTGLGIMGLDENEGENRGTGERGTVTPWLTKHNGVMALRLLIYQAYL